MIDRRVSIGLAVLLVIGVVLATAVGGVAGHSHEGYAVEQGDQCVPVAPVTGDETADAFYDYRAADSDYSSQATEEYQDDDTSLVMLYDGPDGLSLVIVHDRWHEDPSDGTTGASVSFAVTGHPADGEWSVLDDDYPNQTDEYELDETESELHWTYAEGRTDGAVFTGLGDDFHVQIDARWNEDARLHGTYDGPYDGVIDDWQVISATDDGDGFDRVSLDSLNESVTVRSGDCSADGIDATLDAPDEAEVGTEVTLDASASESDEEVEAYHWDLTGDGEVDVTTDDPVLERTFEELGERTVSVTIEDETGGTDTATATVTVVDETPPEAALDAPDEVAVGASVTFDGGASTDNHRIAEYEWDFGDGETASGQVVEHAYDDAGEYEVSLTVIDEAGNTDTATTTIEVSDDLPRAALDAPDEVAVEEEVTLDASGSSAPEGVDRYEWAVDGEVVAETETSTHEHVFDEPGEYDVEVTVVDENGETDTASATVEVAPEPDAVIDVDDETGTTADPMSFDASDSTGAIEAYEWDFGDGETATGATVEHTYDEPDQYEVELTVTDSAGATDTTTVTVTVELPPPDASLDVPEEFVVVDEETTLDASDTTVATENATYAWEIDGEVVAETDEATLEWTFDDSREYEVAATVTDDDDRTDTATTTVDVWEEEPDEPDAALSAPSEATVGESVHLDASDATVTVENPTYAWEIDGEVVAETDEATLEWTFDEPGEREVAVTVTDGAGRSDAAESTVDVVADESENAGSAGGTGGAHGGTTGGTGDSGLTDDPESEPDPEPDISVAGIASETAVAGEPFDVTVSLRNVGDADGEETVPVIVDGETVDEVDAAVAADGEIETTVTVVVEEPGEATVEVGDRTETVTVLEAVADLSVISVDAEASEIAAGETVTIVAVVENAGTVEGEFSERLTIDGASAGTVDVTVGPDERERVTITQRIESPGTYEFALGGVTTTVEVVEADGATDDDRSEDAGATTDETPGFTVAVAVLALVAWGFAARRRT